MRTLLIALTLVLPLACATTPEPHARAEPAAPSPAAEEPVVEDDPDRDPLEAPSTVSAPPEDARRTQGGVASQLLRRGTGTRHPGTFSVVRVNYTGWTTDGQMFDSSVARGEPAEFALNNVILGWRYGLKLMVEGEKRRFWIPEDLAYKGQSGPQGMLVFDVELLEIVKP